LIDLAFLGLSTITSDGPPPAGPRSAAEDFDRDPLAAAFFGAAFFAEPSAAFGFLAAAAFGFFALGSEASPFLDADLGDGFDGTLLSYDLSWNPDASIRRMAARPRPRRL
jgi:hypothetical protein